MFQSSSRFNKQNERIRTLEKQLEAKERELADQKWVFEQFLQSPSWRLTYPIRWMAKQIRAMKGWFGPKESVGAVYDRPGAHRAPLQEPDTEQADDQSDAKEFFTALQRIQLQTFLTSNAKLQLPHDAHPEVSIVLVLFNRAELTLACLRSIQENYFRRIEVILVDNASTDETPLLLDRVEGARIVRNSENLNFNEGVRQGAREARGENLLILNNDAQLMPGTLEAALSALRSSPDIGAVGARIILLDGTLQEAGSIVWQDGSCVGYGRGDDPAAPMYMFRRDVDYCSGAFVLTPRSIWERLGGFDEIFKPMYYEETDYCMRLWENGLRVVYEPRAAILHYEFASSSSVKNATDLQRRHQQVFLNRHRQTLARHDAPHPNSILPARSHDRSAKRLLFLEDRVPHTWLGSGFPRAQTILRGLVKQGYFVTFYPLSIYDESWTAVYSEMPAEVEFMMSYGPQMLEAFLRNRAGYYDTILVSRPHNMKILKTIMDSYPDWFEDLRIIYDAEALFVGREITQKELIGAPLSNEEITQITKEEVDLAASADCVISVSDYERATFRKHGIGHCEVLGHSLPVNPASRSFAERTGFLFVGAIHEEASPNGDSMIWFLTEILPRIRRELGDAPFTIVGLNKSDRIRELAQENVRILGYMKDVQEFYNSARVFVAPTRYAAGIPHKVHEAAARGLPVVATPLLAKQLGWEDGNPFAVGVDAESFAQKCVELHTNQAVWERIRDAALSRIRTECSQAAFDAQLKRIFELVSKEPSTRFADVGMDR